MRIRIYRRFGGCPVPWDLWWDRACCSRSAIQTSIKLRDLMSSSTDARFAYIELGTCDLRVYPAQRTDVEEDFRSLGKMCVTFRPKSEHHGRSCSTAASNFLRNRNWIFPIFFHRWILLNRVERHWLWIHHSHICTKQTTTHQSWLEVFQPHYWQYWILIWPWPEQKAGLLIPLFL